MEAVCVRDTGHVSKYSDNSHMHALEQFNARMQRKKDIEEPKCWTFKRCDHVLHNVRADLMPRTGGKQGRPR